MFDSNRRAFMKRTAGAVAAAALTATANRAIAGTATQATDLADAMADAADRFLARLDRSERQVATFAFKDDERHRWHWSTHRAFRRAGLPLMDMDAAQAERAFALLSTGLSEAGFDKARNIMELQNQVPLAGADPRLFFVSIFGTPGGRRWGWRFEGHHLSHHFTVVDGAVAVTPFFHGAWPTKRADGFRTMPREEDAAREIVLLEPASQRDRLILSTRAPRRHETGNRAFVSPLAPVGARAGDLDGRQQALLRELLSTYLSAFPPTLSAAHMQAIDLAGFDAIRFGRAGSLIPERPHYYRIQGPTFLLEFDNSRNNGTHIHSVWRDFQGDFGAALLTA